MPYHVPDIAGTAITDTPHIVAAILAAIVAALTALGVALTQRKK